MSDKRLADLEAWRRKIDSIPLSRSFVDPFLLLPELRGLWMASNVNESGNLLDLTGQGRTLTNNGTTTRAVYNNLVPYCDLNGSTQYFSRADEAGLDITGALTICGWNWFDVIAGSARVLAAKATAAPNIAYALYSSAAGVPSGYVSVDGTNLTIHTLSTVTFSVSRWYFFAITFTPSVELRLLVDQETSANTTSIPAAIANTNAAFSVGAAATPGSYLDGRIPIVALCAAAASQQALTTIFQQTRGYFGV